MGFKHTNRRRKPCKPVHPPAFESQFLRLIQQYRSSRKQGDQAGMGLIKRQVAQLFKTAGITLHWQSDNPLSFMELMCLALFAMGKETKEVARLLLLEPSTVTKFEARARSKLLANNRQRVIYQAVLQRYLSFSPCLCA